jgi:zinc and cadmium transporter
MQETILASLTSVIIVSLISLIGVFYLFVKTNTMKKLIFLLVGFAAGALLGDVFIHLLPEISKNGFGISSAFYILSGIIAFFILEKVVRWHHCHNTSGNCHEHSHLATMNLVGDGFHNLIDGMIIAGSYLAGMQIGIATTIAVILHEIPQEIGDFAILLHSGMKKGRALFLNFMSALAAVIGAAAVLMLQNFTNTLSFIIPFTAGGFLYIAVADLIPELHKKNTIKSAIMQLITIIIGIAIMYALTLIE